MKMVILKNERILFVLWLLLGLEWQKMFLIFAV
jgi:hypothetical protein